MYVNLYRYLGDILGVASLYRTSIFFIMTIFAVSDLTQIIFTEGQGRQSKSRDFVLTFKRCAFAKCQIRINAFIFIENFETSLNM